MMKTGSCGRPPGCRWDADGARIELAEFASLAACERTRGSVEADCHWVVAEAAAFGWYEELCVVAAGDRRRRGCSARVQ